MTILKNLIPILGLLALGSILVARAESPPSSAAGETYAVTGVERADVLNIRARPEANAAVVGAIPANGVGIRLLGSTDPKARSTWREVEYQGMRGWVNARFLTVQTVSSETQGLAADLRCLGTEPFWGVRIQGAQMELDQMGSKSRFSLSVPRVSANHTNVWSITVKGAAPGQRGVVFVERTDQCSDNMSDERYRYTFRIRLASDVVLSGCCNRIP